MDPLASERCSHKETCGAQEVLAVTTFEVSFPHLFVELKYF